MIGRGHLTLLGDLARAALAVVALVVLLAGLPWVLVRFVGWPLPRSLPAWETIAEVLARHDPPEAAVIKFVACAGWLAWVQLLASVVVEGRAWFAGRIADRLPAGVLQPFVQQLVVSILVVVPTIRGEAIAAAALTAPAPPALELVAAPAPTAPNPDDARTAASTVVAATKTYVVRRYDSLWRIAERHLGDGLRWVEIFELNHGGPQPDGRVLTNPNLIHPGWVLVLPDDATGLDDPVDAAPAPHAPASTANAPAPPVTAAPTSTPAPTPARSPSGSEHATPSTTDESEGDDRRSIPVPGSVVGLGLFAAGVVGLLNVWRRVQQRRRPHGHDIPLPAGRAAAVEGDLRDAADDDGARHLESALRALAGVLRSHGDGSTPTIAAIGVAPAEIEILFAAPVDASESAPFTVEGGGQVWRLRRDHDWDALAAHHGDSSVLAPALVVVGRHDDREVVLDLEAPPCTVLDGDPERVAALLWTMAVGLATSPWPDDLEVIVVGEVPEVLARIERVTPVASLDEVVDKLDAATTALRAELDQAGHATTLAARVATGDTWDARVVLVPAARLGDPALSRLREIAARRAGVSVVVAGGDRRDNDRLLALDGDEAVVSPPDIRISAPPVASEVRAAVEELLERAHLDAAVARNDDDRAVAAPPPASTTQVPPEARVGEVVVGVIGHPLIEPLAEAIDRENVHELIEYLAYHPRGASEAKLKSVLWRDQSCAPTTFHSVVSRARKALGNRPDGLPYLPRVDGGRYCLDELVVTADRRIEAAHRRASADPCPATMGALAKTLELVRGTPYDDTPRRRWAYEEGIVAHIERVVADAAHDLATWALDEGDVDTVLWATRRGLDCSPTRELLYRDRMLGYDLAGDPDGVEATMVELCEALELVEPYDSLHPDTIALYERLSRRPRPPGPRRRPDDSR